MGLYEDIQKSIKIALEWLKGQQNADGSWGKSPDPLQPYLYSIGVTGLALLKFEINAVEMGLSPFDDRYIYKDVVVRGLRYLFDHAQYESSIGKIYFRDSIPGVSNIYQVNYSTGIALAAICANAQPDTIVNSINSFVNGKKYKDVAQSVVDYLTYSQEDNGGWGYFKGYKCPDNSVTGYTVLGLDFAKSEQFNYKCTVPESLKTKLKNWISIIQAESGGSKYTPDPDCTMTKIAVNILKTGNLLEEMKFCDYSLGDTRVQKAMTYIADNWNAISCVNDCAGWNGNPAEYQATFTTMKGLSEYDVKTIVSSTGITIYWFEEMARVIVDQQNADGSWNFTGEDNTKYNATPILSTAWAVLKIERAIPLQCNGTLSISKESCKCIACLGENIPYTIKLKNKGPGNSYNILVREEIPSGVYVNSTKVTRGEIMNYNDYIIWSIPELDAGETEYAMIIMVATENVCINNNRYITNTCEVTSCAGTTINNIRDTAITFIDCFGCECCKKK